MYQYTDVDDLDLVSSELQPSLIVRRKFELEPNRSVYLINRYSCVKPLNRNYGEYVHNVVEFRDCDLEYGPECLPPALREVFYHVNFKYRSFNVLHPNSDLYALMCFFETVVVDLEKCIAANDLLIDVSRILQTLLVNSKLNYTIDTMFGPVPWNDTILPILSMPLPAESLVRYKIDRPKISLGQTLPEMDIDKIYTRDYLMSVIKTYTTGGVGTDRISDDTLTRFVKHTKNISPALNGTACVGKSTILRNITSCAQKSLGPDFDGTVQVLKLSQYGGFKDKDINDLVGMQCLPVLMHACEEYSTSVTDRCVFNNIIWKLIMSLFDASSDQELMEGAYKALHTLNLNLLEFMKKFPIFVLVDSSILLNRKRMFNRGVDTLEKSEKVTGDLFRCKIVPYVKAQNVIYGTLATLCDWPVIDVGYKFPLTADWMSILTNTFCNKLVENYKVSKALALADNISRDFDCRGSYIEDSYTRDYGHRPMVDESEEPPAKQSRLDDGSAMHKYNTRSKPFQEVLVKSEAKSVEIKSNSSNPGNGASKSTQTSASSTSTADSQSSCSSSSTDSEMNFTETTTDTEDSDTSISEDESSVATVVPKESKTDVQNKMRNSRVVYKYRHSEYPILSYLAAKAMKVFK
nr:hypothetical protein HvNV085 [Heliothis virescens nudivirus]